MASIDPATPLEDSALESFCQMFVYATSLDAVEAYKMVNVETKDLDKKEIEKRTRDIWKKKEVRNRVKYLTESRNDIQLVDKFWVMSKLKEIVNQNEGRPQYQLKALELLGKAIDMFKDVNKEAEKIDDPGKLAKEAFAIHKFEVFNQQKEGELNVAS